MSNIGVFLGSNSPADKQLLTIASELGIYIAKSQDTLIYGGAKNGLMGLLAKSTLSEGGKVIGILPTCLEKVETPMPNLSKLIIANSMSERKNLLFDMSDIRIILPGGIGTLEECVEILSRIKIHLEKKPIILLNHNNFFDPLISLFNVMIKNGFLSQAFFQSYILCHTLEDTIRQVEAIKKSTGMPVN